jgi:glycerate 2-kinase
MKNILVAPNSFKECADAVRVVELFKKYLDKSIFNVIQKPISDGGDGFLNVCKQYFKLETLTYSVSTPYDESRMDCNIGVDRINKTIYIESANILGLKRIPKDKRHPLTLSSKGLGDLFNLIIKDIIDLKISVDKVIIGIGGTGTMDMGLGVCSLFGLKLFDSYKNELPVVPENFVRIAEYLWQDVKLPFSIETIIDVNNPLLGKDGGAKVFGSQKGATKGEIKVIELGWNKLLNLFIKNGLIDLSDGLSGAGGGLEAGLEIFFDSTAIHANEFITGSLSSEIINKIDMVVTGEGAFDNQSLMGKGAGIVVSMFQDQNIPIVLCCGRIDESVTDELSMNVFPIELGRFYNSTEESIRNFEESIKLACNEIAGMTDILTKIS